MNVLWSLKPRNGGCGVRGGCGRNQALRLKRRHIFRWHLTYQQIRKLSISITFYYFGVSDFWAWGHQWARGYGLRATESAVMERENLRQTSRSEHWNESPQWTDIAWWCQMLHEGCQINRMWLNIGPKKSIMTWFNYQESSLPKEALGI